MILDPDQLAAWKHDEAATFTGWDFSYIANRIKEELPPWSYMDRARDLMQSATSLLDMDTGGGERLLELRQHWPPRVSVTEAYPPNHQLVRERLKPLGVSVFNVGLSTTGLMPFDDSEFDLVLNRHGAFNPSEVSRILENEGTFLTRQVHGRSTEDLMAVFDSEPQWPDSTPEFYRPKLEKAGLTIKDIREFTGNLQFSDVGALVYYLSAVPLVPGFSVEGNLDALTTLQNRLDDGQGLVFETKNYLIEASK